MLLKRKPRGGLIGLAKLTTFTKRGSAPSPSFPLSGLLGGWSFEESVGGPYPERTGSGHYATADGGTQVAGIIGNGLNLATRHSWLVSDPGGAFSTQTFSVQVWVNFGDLSGRGVCDLTVVDKSTTNSGDYRNYSIHLGWNGSSHYVYGHFVNAADYSTTVSAALATVGVWHHLVLTFDASTMLMCLYVDGSLAGSLTTSTVPNLSATYFGSITGGYNYGQSYDNTLDEVFIWNVALSSSDVSALYNGGAGLPFPDALLRRANTLGFWDLDTDSNDRSGNGYNGTDAGVTYDSTSAFFGGAQQIATGLTLQLDHFTCSAWFNAVGGGFEAAYERIADKNFTNGFWLGRESLNSDSFGGGVREGSPPYGVYGTAVDGSWHHIVVVRYGIVRSLYIDGSLITTTVIDATITDATEFCIGNTITNDSAFTGNIRCVGLFNEAKDADWVTSVYNGGTPLKWAGM